MRDEQKDLLNDILVTNMGRDICSWTVKDGHQAGTIGHLKGNGYIEILSQEGSDYTLKITPEGLLFLNK